MGHYTSEDLDKVLKQMPMETGDVIFLHSNLGFFGRAEGVTNSEELCNMFLDSLTRRLGKNGTIVVPTFTYSFPRGEVFSIDTPAPAMGIFSEWIRKHPDSIRSSDPCYSVAAIGAKAKALTNNSPENSFAPESFFGRFMRENGAILNLNFDAGSTFLHYLEREFKVPYRFDKTFEGYLLQENGSKSLARSTIYVRYLSSEGTSPVFEPFHKEAIRAGYYISEGLGRGQLGFIRANDCKVLLHSLLPSQPGLLTKSGITGIKPILQDEPTYQPIKER